MVSILAPSISSSIQPLPASFRPAKCFLAKSIRRRTNYQIFWVRCGSSSSDSNMDNKAQSITEDVFRKYSSSKLVRKGKGVAIVWFRNDLRLLDNEVLVRAWTASESVLPVYCFDPRQFGTTHYFGFPKTGELRAQFILEGVSDLRRNLQKKGLDLFIEFGKPEKVLPKLAAATAAHTVFAQKETCSEEVLVEKLVRKNLGKLDVTVGGSLDGASRSSKTLCPKLELVWGATMYHLDDLPFTTSQLPDVYTQFRKGVETRCQVRSTFKLPPSLAPKPKKFVDGEMDWGTMPTLEQLGLQARQQSPLGVMKFVGGETAALHRLQDYFWEKDCLRVYKETRNGMLGPNYSTKFSPWLAFGFISARYIHEEVKRYERERVSNDSTYWVLFELIWRDYFRFVSMKYGNAIFHLEGPRRVKGVRWSQNKELFDCWRNGTTGYPLIDANMKELIATGFMSNRGRQIVCSFLVRDMGIDWRMGAEWFESLLLDYDPCSNYGNWTYGAGVGNDPREDRYFSIPKQAQNYDPDGDYVAHWIPQLANLSKSQRHFPGQAYLKPVVSLKFANSGRPRPESNKLDFSKMEFKSGGNSGGFRGRSRRF
ncbi:hypothetical protein KP509_04G004000 [Ceratopteris richardii]|uniref:Cryptochrome DASH n=1 Tax=Ceratopteris richardii TaxID=49495 RepID=A0A8T2UWT5_CERRI|nr:hypothetical protein KP509_04G004000 [Ceratopteris richardii]